MIVLPEVIRLTHCQTGQQCEAQIVAFTKELAKQIDATWWQIGGSKTARRREGDHDWKWADIWGQHRSSRFAHFVGVQTQDGVIQGAIAYWTNGKSLLDKDLGTVFVHYLATAPRNRPWLVDLPEYRGVGTALLDIAIRHSYLLGLEGRVTLVSLSSERTRGFYEKFGFSQVGVVDDGMIEYELTTEVAHEWLRQKGHLE
jgi:GNAT superfamily N-acetyltransferase